MKNLGVGVLDSGVGGLTVVKEVMRQLPREKIIYFGDNARLPYGPRPKEEVQKFTMQIVNFLLEKKVKMIVIACNTATAHALDLVQQSINIPVVGVIHPGSLAAIKNTRNKKVGVIGTIGTIESGSYEKTLKMFNPEITVYSHACPALVPLVESGDYEGEEAEEIVRAALKGIKDYDFDSLILGCTHYPLIADLIAKELKSNVNILSSAEETARAIGNILYHDNLLSDYEGEVEHIFFTSGDIESFQKTAEKWLNRSIVVKKEVL